MPVHNEEPYVAAALASLREQSYPNLEVVVSDNASTDRTFEICTQHAAEDPRIRVVRFEQNRGATANFQHVLDQARGRYFLWASGHDLWSPNFVAECVALLESNDRACLAFASSNWIDADSAPLTKASGWTDTRGLGPVARFFTILWGNMHPILALMRTSELRAYGPVPSMVGSDLAMLAALALRGDFVHATQATWSRREFRTEPQYGDKLKRYASSEFGLTQSRFARAFPLLALPIALMRIVFRSNIPAIDKLLTVIALLPSLALRYLTGRRAPIYEAKD
jgi:hypothetical protein